MSKDYYQGRKDYGTDRRYVVEGARAFAPTTASTQTGAAGANQTTIRVNADRGVVRLPGIVTRPDLGDGAPQRMQLDDGAIDDLAAEVDTVLLPATAAWVALNFERTIYRVAAYDMQNQAVRYVNVAGTAQADAGVAGAPLWPTVAQIRTAIDSDADHLIPWEIVYGVRVRRTGDLVIVVTYDNTQRPLGVQRAANAQFTEQV